MPKIDIAAVTAHSGSGYPPPFDAPCAARTRRRLGDAGGLRDFGVNLMTLPPGRWSGQRHWHTAGASVDSLRPIRRWGGDRFMAWVIRLLGCALCLLWGLAVGSQAFAQSAAAGSMHRSYRPSNAPTSAEYQRALNWHRMLGSMCAPANHYEFARVERVTKTLKVEEV